MRVVGLLQLECRQRLSSHTYMIGTTQTSKGALTMPLFEDSTTQAFTPPDSCTDSEPIPLGAACCRVCLLLRPAQCRGWCSLTLLLGYGAIRPLMQLIKAAKSNAAAAAAGKDS
jgi:hypothetical protein